MSDDLCPLCGDPLAGEECDRDHVFGKAFGGRIRVDTHKRCNNRFGYGPEGRLHRRNTVLSFMRAICGLPAPTARAESTEGRPVVIDFSTGHVDELATVDVRKDEQAVTLAARGSEKHLKRVIKDWRKNYGDAIPSWGDLTPEQRKTALATDTEIKASMTHDLRDATMFGLKAALEAGVIVYGPEFARSDLAKAIRERLEDPRVLDNNDVPIGLDFLNGLDEQYEHQCKQWDESGLDAPDLPKLGDVGCANDVVLVPFHRNKTVVYVRVVGVPIVPGLLVDAPMPLGDLGVAVAPVLVREGRDSREIVDFAKAMLDPVAEHARLQAESVANEDETGPP